MLLVEIKDSSPLLQLAPLWFSKYISNPYQSHSSR